MHLKMKTALAATVALCALASTAHAASSSFTTPNVVTTAGATSVTFGGTTFVNQGLQGMARLPSSTKDFLGGTLGAFSGMDIDLSAWRKTATGYSGTLFALPDRGPNGIGTVGFSDYAGRVSNFSLTFTPYTSSTVLPAVATSQNQVVLTTNGGIVLRDFNGNVTTGFYPGIGAASVITQNGIQLPGQTTGTAIGKISLDAEALRFLPDKSFYVGDEYGANVYYFDATGKMQGVIKPPAALIPRDATGQVSYSSIVDPVQGRRFNQGMEGIALTPDKKKLVTLLQSATYQDTAGTAQQTRNVTRLMVYDISSNRTAPTPIGDYALELPVYTLAGNGAAANRTAAQSEILALNDTQFLVLARDALGLGLTTGNSVFKSVMLVDTAGATNLAGTTYESTYTPLSVGGSIVSTVVPVKQVELVNMLNSTQLGKFGENLNNTAPTRFTLGEKWEGMALAPVLEEGAPQDFFLFIGNDNDFLSTSCNVNNQDCSQAVDSDSHVLVYRLTLPTYTDPEYLGAMTAAGPAMVELAGQTAVSVGSINNESTRQQFSMLRLAKAEAAEGLSAWVNGSYGTDDWSNFGGLGVDATRDGFRGTFGANYAFGEGFNAGLTAGYGKQTGEIDGALYTTKADGYSFGFYGAYAQGGFYAQLGYALGHVDLDNTRVGAYGLSGAATTSGKTSSFLFETGYNIPVRQMAIGPVVGLTVDSAKLKGYTETGAAGGDITVPGYTQRSAVAMTGAEVVFNTDMAFTPYARVTYNWQLTKKARTIALKLASAQSAMAVQNVIVASANEDFVGAEAGVTGHMGGIGWNLGYTGQFGLNDRTAHLIRAGLSVGF